MIAKVNTTSRITRSVLYGQNEQKGGEVLLYNFVDMAATPNEQAADLNAMSNPYRVKAYLITLSFDDKDTEILRQIPEGERFAFERDVIRAFIEEMVKRGTNLMDCPFVVAHHGNTDNEHFHMTVLTTTIDGHRIHDSFIKKNAIRSAACISERYGLRAAPMALRNETAHQVAVDNGATTTRRPRRVRNHQPGTMDNIQDRIRRRDAIERANRRKEQLRKLIEKIAKEAAAADFAERLKAEGMTLCQKKKEWGVTVMLEDGKERTYSFGQLLVKPDLVAPLLVVPKVAEEKPAEEKADGKKAAKVRKAPKKQTSSFPSRPITNAVRQTSRVLKADAGQSGGQSRENEVSQGNYEEPEENTRRGGMKR